MKKLILASVCILFLNMGFSKKLSLYLFLGGDSVKEHLVDINHSEVKGVQIIYSWKRLEPKKGDYDFSAIDEDYKMLNSIGKKLFIQLQDRSFTISNIPVPKYLQTKEYDYGVEQQTDFPGEGKPLGVGWVTKQWNAKVRDRFQKLISKLAQKYDGKIAGINLPESSIDIDPKLTTTEFCNSYTDSLITNIKFTREEFKKSYVVQYINFLPCEWNNDQGYMQKIFKILVDNKIGIGNPDSVPYKSTQMKNSYPFIHRYKGDLSLITIAVQSPDYTYINPKTGKKYEISDFYNFDKDYIGADIIFWNIQQPQLTEAQKLFVEKDGAK